MKQEELLNFKAWVFDLDGVLTDTADYHFKAWKKLADSLEVPFDEADNERLKGVSRADSLDIILEKSSHHYSEGEKQALMENKNQDYIRLIDTMSEEDLFPGVRELFVLLKSKSIKIALASASKNARTVVSRLGIGNEFDYIANASEVKYSKPAPDIFLKAADGLGILPENCLGIEDAAAGVEAILAAKMTPIGIGDADQLAKAKTVYTDIQSLLKAVNQS